MERRVDNEVPDTDETLVAIRVNLVVVLHLVCDELEQFAASKFHLLFVVLVFHNVRAAAIADAKLFITPLLVGHGVNVFRYALAEVGVVAAWVVIGRVVGSSLQVTLRRIK